MKYSIAIFVIAFSLNSCLHEKKIIITREYIQNKFWHEKKSMRKFNGVPVNELQIFKLKVKNSLNRDSLNYSLEDYINLNLLEIDTINKEQNYWAAIPKTEGVKIYFNKDYKNWKWFCHKTDTFGISIPDDNCTKNNIGKLKLNTWYLFDRIRPEGIYDNKFLVYIYVDNNGKVHKFLRNLSNI